MSATTVSRTMGISLVGVDGELVEIEAYLSAGLPGLSFTGLADTSVIESRERIRAAVLNSGIDWPNRRITLALLPADVRKVGSRFDLGIALAVLGAAGVVPQRSITSLVALAELGLDARLRPVRGVLPSVVAARDAGARRVVVAVENGPEAALVDGVEVRVATDLGAIVGWLKGERDLPRAAAADVAAHAPHAGDLADVIGQITAKRALEVAAAGGHHTWLLGEPGAGKTMLASRLTGLLPPLEPARSLEVTAVHSVAGLLGPDSGLVVAPPLQAPHHSASTAALVGGGSGIARPGAISLAHGGVLFLDEAPEFSPRVLDSLRQPMESGQIVLHRALGAVRYPARFQLVLASNPCPCALSVDRCTCTPFARIRYSQRLSGPLLDRVDLRVWVDPVSSAELCGIPSPAEPSAQVAARVAAARAVAAARWSGLGVATNAEVPGSALRDRRWRLPPKALADMDVVAAKGQLTARGFDRCLRLAWSLADLAGQVSPGREHVSEALFFRAGRGQQECA